jgi:hypothetical protein
MTCPSGWSPIAFNSEITSVPDVASWRPFSDVATAIAAPSNLAALPQATINVDSTAGFATPAGAPTINPEFCAVRVGATDRIFGYTGKNATQFTGCTFGVGTLLTGQAVRQAHVNWQAPLGCLAAAVAELAWAANAAGDRGVRFRFMDGLFNFPGGTKTERACATQVHHVQSGEQPASPTPATWQANPLRIEGYQDAAASLDCVSVPLAAPRLVAAIIGKSPV